MTMHVFDLVLVNGHVIDPASGRDGPGVVGVKGDRIAFVGDALPPHLARETVDVGGAVICPGLVDIHTHVFEYVTNFGVRADDAGIDAGATTIVDAGSAGAWTFGGFKAYVIDQSKTDVRSFPSINVAGALKGGMRGDILHNPGMVDVDDLVVLAKANPELVRGFKCHGESGAISRWGVEVLEKAVEAGDRAGLPLYCHTGELFPVLESNRPVAEQVLEQVAPVLRPGDTLAHVYSSMPDGIMGEHDEVPEIVFRALDKGLHFDIGYGINFSYAIARRMIAAGVLPNTISSDVHGDFGSYHDLRKLDYSLCGAMTRLVALGVPLADVIRRTTLNPAKFIGAELEIGTLEVGTRADITVLDRVKGRWPLKDGRGETLWVEERLMPRLVVRAGKTHAPSNKLLTDLTGRMLPMAA